MSKVEEARAVLRLAEKMRCDAVFRWKTAGELADFIDSLIEKKEMADASLNAGHVKAVIARGLYRKKPVIVEARQLSRENGPELAAWSGGRWHSLFGRGDRGEDISNVLLRTMEGEMRADLGDWIVKGTRGEFYPCKPDAFADTFEAATTPTGTRPATAGSRPTDLPTPPRSVDEEAKP